MPMHDWTRVMAGTYHDFHCKWMADVSNRLNGGLLPDDHEARVEAVVEGTTSDGVVLHYADAEPADGSGGVALAAARPRVRLIESLEADPYARMARHVVIRHASGHRIVAIIEPISPGNKAATFRFRTFLDMSLSALRQGIHLLVIDPFPPTARDPQGIHGALWGEMGGTYTPPPEHPLTLAAYTGGLVPTAYVEPFAVGDALIDMPLFLHPHRYINVPLEESYTETFRRIPRRDRETLEAPAPEPSDSL